MPTSTTMPRVLTWNGSDVPEELRSLPAGKYVVEAVDDVPVLTAVQEAGLREAIAETDAGKGESLDEVRKHVERSLG